MHPATAELIDRRPVLDGERRAVDVAQLRQLARLMDSAFEIPGLKIRLGLDALLGLFPGIGDAMTSLISLYILQAASRHGVPRTTLVRMGANVLVDWALGSIPVFGDMFDVYWKANQWNVELLENHVQTTSSSPHRRRTSDWLFFAGMAAVLIVFLIGSLTILYFLGTWLGSYIGGARS